MECSHEARNIRGLLHQAPDGHWHATFRPAGGLTLVKVSYCPWCGDELPGQGKATDAVRPPEVVHA